MKHWTVLVILAVLCASCSSYETKYVPFKPAEAYPNKQAVNGLTVAAEAFANKGQAEDAFGFNIRGAGLMPVQLFLTNNGGKSYSIVTSQTFLIDDAGQYWQLIPNHEAVNRVEKSTEYANVAKKAGRGSIFGAAGGAILGAAFGILTGRNVIETTLKGTAVGAAGGAVIGGSKELETNKTARTIGEDLRDKGLEGKSIPPESLASGFLFFPGEAKSAKELRLQLRDSMGSVNTLIINLKLTSK